MNLSVDKITRVIAQVCPADANVVIAATKKSKDKWLITSINVCNGDSSARTHSIFVDKNGNVATFATAIAANVSLAANTRVLYEWIDGLPVDSDTTDGTITVQASAGNVVTFTIVGKVY